MSYRYEKYQIPDFGQVTTFEGSQMGGDPLSEYALMEADNPLEFRKVKRMDNMHSPDGHESVLFVLHTSGVLVAHRRINHSKKLSHIHVMRVKNAADVVRARNRIRDRLTALAKYRANVEKEAVAA